MYSLTIGVVIEVGQGNTGDMDAVMRTWPKMTTRREEWKYMGETFAQQWDSIG